MTGSKRQKLKKAFTPTPPAPAMDPENDELMNDLVAQLDSRNKTVQAESANVLIEMQLNNQAEKIESAPKQDAKSRFQARQARKAAALAQYHSPSNVEADLRVARETKEEEEIMARICDDLQVQVHEINPDGHCLFSAIADQLNILNLATQANYTTIRAAASDYIYSHPDDFIPFLPSSGGEDGIGAHDAGFMTSREFEQYCASIRDTAAWGGEPEILALSRFYNVPIHVVQTGFPPIVVHNPVASNMEGVYDGRVVRISYHRRMYGLGEHYNSLRPKDSGLKQISNSIQSILL